MSIYDSFSNWMAGNPTTNTSNWKANKHQEEEQKQSSFSSQFANIKDSLARQQEWGTEGGYKGTFVNGNMAVSPEEAMGMSSADEYENQIAEALAQGITRQGGNY